MDETIENIHKVIDPLFLDDFRKELEEIKAISVVKTRNQKLAKTPYLMQFKVA